MTHADEVLVFADHMGRFYAKQYNFPPTVGRLLGYLSVCEPMQQTIAELSDALLTSRSAITGAVEMLESHGYVSRTRPAGSRMDRIAIEPKGWEHAGFTIDEYQLHAELAQEGLDLLRESTSERRRALMEIKALSIFLTERMPSLYVEWQAFRTKALNDTTDR